MENDTARVEINNLQDLLDLRLTRDFKPVEHKGEEAAFCDWLDGRIVSILGGVGYEVDAIKREFVLDDGRIDYLCKLVGGKYLIIEVKVDGWRNKDLTFSFAVGQLLTYRTLLTQQYQLKKSDVELMLLTDADSVTALGVIAAENLDISMLVVGDNGVKYYGKR